MTKEIVITPKDMLRLAVGSPLRTVNWTELRGAKIVKSAYVANRDEFVVTVEAAFEAAPDARRVPQEIRLEAAQ